MWGGGGGGGSQLQTWVMQPLLSPNYVIIPVTLCKYVYVCGGVGGGEGGSQLQTWVMQSSYL